MGVIFQFSLLSDSAAITFGFYRDFELLDDDCISSLPKSLRFGFLDFTGCEDCDFEMSGLRVNSGSSSFLSLPLLIS